MERRSQRRKGGIKYKATEGRSQRPDGGIKGKHRKLHGQKQEQKLAEKNYLEIKKMISD